ncbi:unnamed protein product [Soboliphyme baturini]|uniref:Uncharacterized protein n=1 Tax=Soboliphyme baturini TaxID=241478 RepID=A0A183J194_9BILA|nr:unnamed protein product [Soboliphyme baturini]
MWGTADRNDPDLNVRIHCSMLFTAGGSRQSSSSLFPKRNDPQLPAELIRPCIRMTDLPYLVVQFDDDDSGHKLVMFAMVICR